MPIAISPLREHITLPTRTTRTIFRGASPSVISSEPEATTSHMSSELVPGPITTFDLLWPLLFLLLPLLLALHRRSKNLRAQKAQNATAALLEAREPAFWTAWRTRDLPVLYGLTELYITGVFPVGPWDVSSLRAWIAEHSEYYLRRLCRAGIVPLYIQGHGLGTRKWVSVDEDTSRDARSRGRMFGSRRAMDDRPACSLEQVTVWQVVRAWWESVLDRWLPTYIQSKRRAYFDFLIPVPLNFDPNVDHCSIQDGFVRTLISKVRLPLHDFSVSIWVPGLADGRATMINAGDPDVALEYGAKSHFKALLPFKKDRVLREGTSWAENMKTVRRQLLDPLSTPVEQRDEELRHDLHYYMKEGTIPILEVPPHISTIRVAIIRVEKRDGSAPDIRLDEFVAQAAWDAGLCHRFSEQAIVENTRSWLDERWLDDLPMEQFLFTTTKAEAATPRRQVIRTVGPAPPTPQELLRREAIQRLKTVGPVPPTQRELLRRETIQRLRTDPVIERARVARETRRLRSEHQQEKPKSQSI